MGELKNNGFFETEVDTLSGWATWLVGVRERGTELIGNLQLEYTPYLTFFTSFYNLIGVSNE